MLKSTKIGSDVSSFIGKLFGKLPVHPNSITILSVILALLGYLTWFSILENKVESLLLFALAFFFDAVDGAIARSKKMESKQGAFLDGIADRIVEFLLLLTLFKIYALNLQIQFALLIILFFGTAMTSFVKAYAEHQQMLKHEEALTMPGIFERTERSIALLVIFILGSLGYFSLVYPLLLITAGLSSTTFIQRFWFVYTKK